MPRLALVMMRMLVTRAPQKNASWPFPVTPDRKPPRLSRRSIEVPDEVEPPMQEFAGKIPCSKTFDDLRLRKTVAQPLTLRISDEGRRFEKQRHEIGAGKDEHDVSRRGTSRSAWAAGFQIDDKEAEAEF